MSEGWVFFVNFIKKLPQMVLLQVYGGAAVAGSSQSGAGKIFPVHYKECRQGPFLRQNVRQKPDEFFLCSDQLYEFLVSFFAIVLRLKIGGLRCMYLYFCDQSTHLYTEVFQMF